MGSCAVPQTQWASSIHCHMATVKLHLLHKKSIKYLVRLPSQWESSHKENNKLAANWQIRVDSGSQHLEKRAGGIIFIQLCQPK